MKPSTTRSAWKGLAGSRFLVVFVLMMALAFALPAQAQSDSDFTYTTANNQITITGYTGSVKAVIIPSKINGLPVTGIGDSAFYDLAVTSVTIPSGVTNIGEEAFSYCSSLSIVTIPSSVTIIGDYAFADTKLTNVLIPSNVTSLGDGVYYGCTSLTSINVSAQNSAYCSVDGILFNKSQTTIVQYPAGEASSSYVIPNTVTTIGDNSFGDCNNLSTITIPSSVTSIGGYAFGSCSKLSGITIPNSVTTLGGEAFAYCTDLTNITIPTSITSIGYGLFGFSGLTNVTIPSSITSIGDYAFAYCADLTNVTIPTSVTSIGDDAFEGCSALTGITIPSSVSSIGDYAFASCTGLTGVTIPNSIASLGDYAFAGCTSLTSVTIPNGVTSIGEGVFGGESSLTNITIPSGITSIGDDAFEGDTLLANIVIPNRVASIGYGAFALCANLTSAMFQGNAPTMAPYVFAQVNNNFTVQYYNGAAGFTSPTWTDTSGDTYPSENVGNKPQAQTITFPAIANQVYGAVFETGATASSGLPVTYSWTGPVTISGNTMTVTGVGTVSIRAHQNGNANYMAAPTVLQRFTATQAAQTITFPAIGNQVYPTGSIKLNATSSSGLTVTYTKSGPATISGNTLTITGTGSVTVGVHQAGNTDYLAAPEASQTFTVSAGP